MINYMHYFENFGVIHFLCPRPEKSAGASSNLIVHPSVRPSVCLSIRLSVIPSRLQTKCNIKSLVDDTVTKLGLYVHLWVPHFTDITCP